MDKKACYLPPLPDLLTVGGDDRIICDPLSGINKYGCPPIPAPQILAYGSATASTISLHGFSAAEQLRDQLEQAARRELPSVTYTREMDRIRHVLSQVLKLEMVPGTDIIFAASGTDIHGLATQLITPDYPLQVVMLEASETGSGVPSALKGDGFRVNISTVRNRTDSGSLRSIKEVSTEVETVVADAVKSGKHVLMILTDVSKTGLISPSPGCILGLQRQFPEQVSVLVDACQFRMALPTLHAYLKCGFMVAMTGSKFVTGPAFAGALLVPQYMGQKLQNMMLPSHSSLFRGMRGDWPHHWNIARQSCVDDANYGLLLRWEAALVELQAFMALPENEVYDFLKAFASAVFTWFANSPVLELLPMPALDRTPIVREKIWDHIQTIFPFTMKGTESKDMIEMLYHHMRVEGYQVGQPVLYGMRKNTPLGALRLCSSMRLVVDALSLKGRGRETVIKEAITVLDKASLIMLGKAMP